MANSILTPLMITRECLRVLHQKSNFIGRVNRQYDNRFAIEGAKIGQTLNIRMPPKYTTRTGAAMVTQDYVDRSTPLSITSQYGVDLSFTSVELTLSLQDFSERIIDPAMAQLMASIEGACLSEAMKLTADYTGTTSTQMDYKTFQQNGANITRQLAPLSQRTAILNPGSQVEFNDAVKGLYQASTNIAEQYKEGQMGRTGGFDVYENTLLPSHTIGTLAGTPLTTGATIGVSTTANAWASQTTLGIDGATSGTTLKGGDVLTFGTLAAGLVDCQPETKVSYGKLKKFVVQSDVTFTTAADTYQVTVKPALIYGAGNAYQNAILTKADTDNMTVTNWGAASTNIGQSLFFHKDAFVFGTADLVDVAQFGAWGARERFEGISARLARQYVIGSDTVPCRFDILCGFGPLYNQLASKHINSLA